MNQKIEIPIQTRLADVGTVDPNARTVQITWTTGAAVKRINPASGEPWTEELSCDPSAVRMGRMQNGAPLLNTHNRYDLSGVLGVVENAKVDGVKGTATVRFSKRADVDPIFQDVRDGIIRNVSVGYTVYRYDDITTPDDIKNRITRMRAVDWEPSEVSLVPVGADAAAGVRNPPAMNNCVIGSRMTHADRLREQEYLEWQAGVRSTPQAKPTPAKPLTAAEAHQLRLRQQELAERESL